MQYLKLHACIDQFILNIINSIFVVTVNRLTIGLCVDCAVPQLLDTLEEGGEDRGHGAELRLQPGRHRRNLVQERERRLQRGRVLAVLRLYSQSGDSICVCRMLIVACIHCIHGWRQNLEAESGAFKVDPFLFFKVDYNINIHNQ